MFKKYVLPLFYGFVVLFLLLGLLNTVRLALAGDADIGLAVFNWALMLSLIFVICAVRFLLTIFKY